jgi:hypothetical protein
MVAHDGMHRFHRDPFNSTSTPKVSMDLRKRCSQWWLVCCLTVCGCGGTTENSVAPPGEGNIATQREEFKKRFSDRQSNQEKINKAVKAAKLQNN